MYESYVPGGYTTASTQPTGQYNNHIMILDQCDKAVGCSDH